MTTPLVTALIPAYNAAATIRRAVDSVLAQTYRNYEIIVIDDASRDATADIVASSYGDRVMLLRLPQNHGESGAMNAGISAAQGELVAFLDADDEWLPEKLAVEVETLENNPNAAMATTGCHFVDPQGNITRVGGLYPLIAQPAEVWRLLLATTMVAKPCVIARANALRAVGPFDTSLAVGADQDMWIRLALIGEIEFVPRILTVVHDTAGSLTKVYADKVDRYMLPMIRRHVAQQRARLSRREIRAILGERYATVGRNLYFAGSLTRGATLLLQAAFLGHRIKANLWYLITASPPIKTVKRLSRRFGAEARSNKRTRKSTV
jgi:glycosyltransferase involved in cell wall biosynthesis